MDSMKNIDNVFLADKQIGDKAKSHADNMYKQDEPGVISSEGCSWANAVCDYISGWKESTEHYKELIEAGVRQKEPVDKVDALFYIIKGIQIMSGLSDEEVGEIIDNVIARRNKAKQTKKEWTEQEQKNAMGMMDEY